MTESKICTCPSGDGSLRWPCPAHPAVEQAGGDERAAFELFVRKHCGMPEHIAVNWDAKFTNDAWEGWQARAALAQPSPTPVCTTPTGENCPGDGVKSCKKCPEQAEAERPEVVAYLFVKPDGTLSMDAVRHKPSQPAVAVMTVAQHERIVGALRAENAKLSEALDRWPLIRDSLKLRLADALDKISKLESRWPHGESPEERFEHYISNTIDRAPEPLRRLGNWLSHVLDEDQWTTAERMLTGACVAAEERAAAQTQHSVPEGYALIPVRETEAMHDAVMALLYKGVARTDTQKLLDAYIAAAPGKEGV
ncbi:hypothetical protein RY873_001275 [Pseudomonas aeruginosa]|nr:hypothetical protein [Pseudomonas aeruginosa]ELN2057903.1 hypothetical protein [Pseudomonas aeruginosa]